MIGNSVKMLSFLVAGCLLLQSFALGKKDNTFPGQSLNRFTFHVKLSDSQYFSC